MSSCLGNNIKSIFSLGKCLKYRSKYKYVIQPICCKSICQYICCGIILILVLNFFKQVYFFQTNLFFFFKPVYYFSNQFVNFQTSLLFFKPVYYFSNQFVIFQTSLLFFKPVYYFSNQFIIFQTSLLFFKPVYYSHISLKPITSDITSKNGMLATAACVVKWRWSRTTDPKVSSSILGVYQIQKKKKKDNKCVTV